MKRWLAVLLLMVGGLSTEAVRPLQCELITSTRMGEREPDRRKGDKPGG